MPPCTKGPVLTVRSPSLNGAFWAIAGAGNRVKAAAAPAAVPAKTVRRLSLRELSLRDIAVCSLGAPLAKARSLIVAGTFPRPGLASIIQQAVCPVKSAIVAGEIIFFYLLLTLREFFYLVLAWRE